MKRTFIRLLSLSLLAGLLQGCYFFLEDDFIDPCYALNGYYVTDQRFEPDFWGVQAYDNLPVTVVNAPRTYIEVTADAGVQPYIRTQVAPDGVLEVWYDGPACARWEITEIYIEGPGLDLFPTADRARTEADSLVHVQVQ